MNILVTTRSDIRIRPRLSILNTLIHIIAVASYNVSSVVYVFSMLTLGRILISGLVVTNMFMYYFPGIYDSSLFGHAFFTEGVST